MDLSSLIGLLLGVLWMRTVFATDDFRYVLVKEGIGADHHIHGNENITDCAFIAFSQKSAAFYHFSNTSGTYCGIVDKVSIEPKKDPNILYYLIDADLSEIEICPNGAQSACDVAQEAKSCGYDNSICDALKEIVCSCQWANNSNCLFRQITVIQAKKSSRTRSVPRDRKFSREKKIAASSLLTKMDEKSAANIYGTTKMDGSIVVRRISLAAERGRKPRNPGQMKKLCTDIKSLPVQIENKQQNDDLNSLDKWNMALIGLHIPKGQPWEKNGFRWLSDGSKPSYTNWGVGEPNNVVPHEMFVRAHKAGGTWFDITNTDVWLPNYIICMADAHLGVDEQQ
uniref:C-type lectin domain-containing protein n=1 Tax=Steinernema glaseri TaxID=37863 RepID=A0A1I8ARS4_9BILA